MPTTLPTLSALTPHGNTSALLSEDSFASTISGLAKTGSGAGEKAGSPRMVRHPKTRLSIT